MSTVIVMHYGGDIVRGSEICLFQSIEAIVSSGKHVVLLRNEPVVDPHLAQFSEYVQIVDFEYPEIMIDGSHRSFPILRYFSALKQLSGLINVHQVEVLFCNSGLPCQLAVAAARINRIAVVCHFHHPAAKRYFYLWLVRWVDRLIFPSRYTAKVVKQKCGRSGKVVYNAVDLETQFLPADNRDVSFKRTLGIHEDAIVFGQVGALVPHKRPDMLLRCFARLTKESQRVHLVLVGNGPLREMLEKEVRRLKMIDHVTITGYVESVLPFYQSVFDVNVLASEEEGLGISVIEASGCELPSIIADCTGLSETVQHEQTGLKFPPYNEDQLLCMLRELSQDKGLRNRLGKAARSLALEKFHLNAYREGIIEAINGEI